MKVLLSIKTIGISLLFVCTTVFGQQKPAVKVAEKGKITQSKELLKDSKAVKVDSIAKSKAVALADSLAAVHSLIHRGATTHSLGDVSCAGAERGASVRP